LRETESAFTGKRERRLVIEPPLRELPDGTAKTRETAAAGAALRVLDLI
jgi:hypothetical protein